MSTEGGPIQPVPTEVHGELDLLLDVVSSTISCPNIQSVIPWFKVPRIDFHVSCEGTVVSINVGNSSQVSPRGRYCRARYSPKVVSEAVLERSHDDVVVNSSKNIDSVSVKVL